MKTASSAMQTHLAGDSTTLAYLWKVHRLDGLILGFTTHDQKITYDAGDGDGALTYCASSGFTNTAGSGRSDLSVDNMEVTAFLDSSSITEFDLRNSRYDNADIAIRLVNWADLTMGDVLLRRGTLGQAKWKNGMATTEIRGLAHKLTARIGSTYGPICRATFGSGLNSIDMTSHWKCMFDVTTVRQTGSLATVTDTRTLGITIDAPTTNSDSANWFKDGFLTFSSGVLAGLQFEVKSSTAAPSQVLEFFLPLPELPTAGDAFTIEAGCNKTTSDCQGKFNNIANFRGEPYIPGMDQLLDYPSNQ